MSSLNDFFIWNQVLQQVKIAEIMPWTSIFLLKPIKFGLVSKKCIYNPSVWIKQVSLFWHCAPNCSFALKTIHPSTIQDSTSESYVHTMHGAWWRCLRKCAYILLTSTCTIPAQENQLTKYLWSYYATQGKYTFQGTSISPKNGILKMIFLFPRWDMWIPWRV